MPTPTQQLFLLLPHHSASPWGSASIQASMTLTLSGFILASRGCLNWPPPALPVIHLFLTGAGFRASLPVLGQRHSAYYFLFDTRLR